MTTIYKDRSKTTWKHTSYLQDIPCVGTLVDPTTYTYSTKKWQDSRTGVDRPGWRKDVRLRRQAGTALQALTQNYQSKYWEVLWTAPWASSCGSGYTGRKVWRRLRGTYVNFDATLNTGAMSDNTDNQALSKVLGKIADAQRPLQGMVVLGELAETLRMIRRPASGLRDGLDKYLDDVKRRVKLSKRKRGRPTRVDPAAVTRLSKVLADTWLEHVFGWVPLISDIESGFKALNQIHERNLFPTKVVTAQATVPAVTQQSTIGLYGDTSPVYGYWDRDRNISTRYKVAVALEPRDLGQSVLDSFGLRAREFIPAVWELIPYSFVADYFTTIGDVITSASVQRSRILWIVKTRRTTYENTIKNFKANSFYGSDGTTRWVSVPHASYMRREVDRSTPAYLNTPSLEFEIPGLSSRKWLNLAALFRSGRNLEGALKRSYHL